MEHRSTTATSDGEDRPRASVALLQLTDGRFPAGAHAHSGGLEAAVALEGVRDIATLESFLRGRAATTGAIGATFAAAACAATHRACCTSRDDPDTDGYDRAVATLNVELDARTPSPALRSASRRLARQLLRAGRAVWPHPCLDRLVAFPRGVQQPIATGAVAAAAGVDPHAAALTVAYDAVNGPATAAIRLLGIDPYAVHAMVARLGPVIDTIAERAVTQTSTPPDDLPAWSAPLLDISAERHAAWEVRLFAS